MGDGQTEVEQGIAADEAAHTTSPFGRRCEVMADMADNRIPAPTFLRQLRMVVDEALGVAGQRLSEDVRARLEEKRKAKMFTDETARIAETIDATAIGLAVAKRIVINHPEHPERLDHRASLWVGWAIAGSDEGDGWLGRLFNGHRQSGLDKWQDTMRGMQTTIAVIVAEEIRKASATESSETSGSACAVVGDHGAPEGPADREPDKTSADRLGEVAAAVLRFTLTQPVWLYAPVWRLYKSVTINASESEIRDAAEHASYLVYDKATDRVSLFSAETKTAGEKEDASDQLFIKGAVDLFLDQYGHGTIHQLAQVAGVSNQAIRRYVADSDHLDRDQMTIITRAVPKKSE